MNRRDFLSAAALPMIQVPGPERAAAHPVTDGFPMQPAEMVKEMVIVSHGNAKRVRELVDAHPALARAAMDWGFGDWEDALGAASHVGNREIAEYLIARGARPTLFSATMLGQLDVVKAFLVASPGAQRIAGPHSISLLSHAKAGGAAARPVYDYLQQIGDADGPQTAPMSDDEKASLAGTYIFGDSPADRITIAIDKGAVMFNRPGMPYPRGLYHLGDRTFFPMGAAAVRMRFETSADRVTLTVHDPDVVLTAIKRI